ncbi:MAG: AmmeMemoRadiSam system radical SAM enzyme [Thermodesulfobacteriota bacterium]|nr:AmmeMemoRadiSam system radical SAM enzyme [Thermodesulfobacteriota bacterium]
MKTLIFEELDKNRVKCGICNHFCIIEDGKRGICNVRENRGGSLESLVYPKVVARSIDPVEKKPVFHLKPGSSSYSIATVGCNFKCSFCQNSDIAQMPSDHGGLIRGVDTLPEDIVKQAVRGRCESISYTYTEPTVYFELAFETAKIAKEQGLLNIFVTNGYMSSQVIKMIAPYLDAANVDLKSFNDKFYRKECKAKIEPVKENLKLMKSSGILVEVTTLLIPGLNDDPGEIRAIADFIADSLGIETPWHISRFHPCYRLTHPNPTPVASLEKAYKIGKDAGLRYVYTGNVPGLESENTFCHSCGRILVKRSIYDVENYITAKGRCPDCNTEVYGIF